MAFIETYISTVSGGSELSSYFEEVAEWSSAADVSAHELAIKESYDLINSFLDAYMTVPVAKEPTSGRYHALVRQAQAYIAIAKCRERKQGRTDEVVKTWAAADAAVKAMVEARSQFEVQHSPDELGIGNPIPGASNTSTAWLQVDRRQDYTGDHEQTYTVTITTAGAIGTAVYSWADGEGTTHTANTSSYDWAGLENGIYIRFLYGTGANLVISNTWTIRGVPASTPATSAAGGLQNIELRK